MQPLEHKAPTLSFLNKEDENILRAGRHAWPKSQPQSQPHTSTPSHDKNSSTRKALVPKKVEKTRRARAPVKRRYKVRIIAKPMPVTPTFLMNLILPAVPTSTVAISTAPTQKNASGEIGSHIHASDCI